MAPGSLPARHALTSTPPARFDPTRPHRWRVASDFLASLRTTWGEAALLAEMDRARPRESQGEGRPGRGSENERDF